MCSHDLQYKVLVRRNLQVIHLIYYSINLKASERNCYTSNMLTHRINWKTLLYTVSGSIILVGLSTIISLLAIPTGVNDVKVFKELPTDPSVEGVTILTSTST